MYAMLMPAGRAEEMVRTNILGSLFVAREAAKMMRRKVVRPDHRDRVDGDDAGAGRRLDLRRNQGGVADPDRGVLAKEFGGYGITVNTVAVTALETDMLRQLPREKGATRSSRPCRCPRMATPDDIFNVVDFFASPRSSYITAQTMFLGGVHG